MFAKAHMRKWFCQHETTCCRGRGKKTLGIKVSGVSVTIFLLASRLRVTAPNLLKGLSAVYG